MKRHAPATLRNREPIAQVLAKEMPQTGTVLEIASGSGEHAVYFAERFPKLEWQPSDPDPEALASIDAYRAEADLANIEAPIMIDAASPPWPIDTAVAIVCINMIHISPWAATTGLFAEASRLLCAGAPLVLYGPYLESDVPTAQSNLEFDASLRSRNPEWGLRNRDDVERLAAQHGLSRSARYEMPANNLMLVFRRS